MAQKKVYKVYTKDRNDLLRSVYMVIPRKCCRTSTLSLMELFREYKEHEEVK